MEKLSDTEIKVYLAKLSGWRVEENTLKKDFEFKDFTEAFNFMSQLAQFAETINHHPDWNNSYNRVSIGLTTHQANGLTSKDFEFAEAADKTAASINNAGDSTH